jgi:peptide subunit release factor RF-3
MDRIGSSVLRTADAIKGLLKADPIFFQYPVGQGENFKGVVDLLTMNFI